MVIEVYKQGQHAVALKSLLLFKEKYFSPFLKRLSVMIKLEFGGVQLSFRLVESQIKLPFFT